MNDNAYRVRAERGEVQLGTWVTMIRTPAVLTLLKTAGLDFARIDMEHSPFSIETVADMAALARAMDFPMVVRPPEGNREWITRLLGAGVWEVDRGGGRGGGVERARAGGRHARAGRRGRGVLPLRAPRRAGHVRLWPTHRVPEPAARRAHGGRERARTRDDHARDQARLL